MAAILKNNHECNFGLDLMVDGQIQCWSIHRLSMYYTKHLNESYMLLHMLHIIQFGNVTLYL